MIRNIAHFDSDNLSIRINNCTSYFHEITKAFNNWIKPTLDCLKRQRPGPYESQPVFDLPKDGSEIPDQNPTAARLLPVKMLLSQELDIAEVWKTQM